VAHSCELGDELWLLRKAGNFLTCGSGYWLLKKDTTPCNESLHVNGLALPTAKYTENTGTTNSGKRHGFCKFAMNNYKGILEDHKEANQTTKFKIGQ